MQGERELCGEISLSRGVFSIMHRLFARRFKISPCTHPHNAQSRRVAHSNNKSVHKGISSSRHVIFLQWFHSICWEFCSADFGNSSSKENIIYIRSKSKWSNWRINCFRCAVVRRMTISCCCTRKLLSVNDILTRQQNRSKKLPFITLLVKNCVQLAPAKEPGRRDDGAPKVSNIFAAAVHVVDGFLWLWWLSYSQLWLCLNSKA